jgi:hypothetical protein
MFISVSAWLHGRWWRLFIHDLMLPYDANAFPEDAYAVQLRRSLPEL